MSGAPVELKVGGQTYRVVTSAPRPDLERLAERVEAALSSVVPPGRQASEQAFVLAAITLAHDLEQKEQELRRLEDRYRNRLTSLLAEVDRALGCFPDRAEEPQEGETSLDPALVEAAPAEVYSIRKNGLGSSRFER